MQKFDFAGKEGTVKLLTMAELKELSGEYPHKRAFYRSMNPIQYCKAEIYGECLFGTMRLPGFGREMSACEGFGFYLKEGELLFVEEGKLLKKILAKLAADPTGEYSLNQFLLLVLEALLEDDVIFLQQQEKKLSDMEEKLLKRIPEHFYETIIQYRKRLSNYHSYYEQLINMGYFVQSGYGQKLTQEEKNLWQLYVKHVERLHDHVEMLREYLIQIRELYQSLIAVQQNKVMSFLTIVTTIFLPLTLIAGWYGMNFPNMPEFRWKYSYLAVIIISLMVIVLEFCYFKKKKML